MSDLAKVGDERRLIGPPHAHQDRPCTDACYEPVGARDADGFLRLKGTATGDNQLDPAPQSVTDAQYADQFRRIAASEAEILTAELVVERLAMAAMNLRSARRRITGDYVNPERHLDPLPPLDGALDEIDRARRLLTGEPESGPLVLTLPQVPDGAVALVGDQTWRKVKVPGITMPCWQSSLTGPLDFGAVLDAEPNGVTVEMAPPREPRVWPKLDEAPDDITWLRGASGTRYGCDKLDEGIPVFRAINELTGESEGRSYSFHVLQFLDGPLTEVVES